MIPTPQPLIFEGVMNISRFLRGSKTIQNHFSPLPSTVAGWVNVFLCRRISLDGSSLVGQLGEPSEAAKRSGGKRSEISTFLWGWPWTSWATLWLWPTVRHGKWSIEIGGLPVYLLKLVDLSMAMLNNQMLYGLMMFDVLFFERYCRILLGEP